MKARSRAALSYLYKHIYHAIVSNQDSLTYGAKCDSYVFIQILGFSDVVLEPFCVFLSQSVQYVMQYFAFLQGNTFLHYFVFSLCCSSISQSAKWRDIVYLMDCPTVLGSCADTICIRIVRTYVRVCNCGEGGVDFLTMGLLNDVCREGFLLSPRSHLKAYSFGTLCGQHRPIGIISGQFNPGVSDIILGMGWISFQRGLSHPVSGTERLRWSS